MKGLARTAIQDEKLHGAGMEAGHIQGFIGTVQLNLNSHANLQAALGI